MKSVLISTKPKWCEKIFSGKKTIEVRKTAPKEVPFKAYIYATKPKARTHPARIYNSYIMPESGKCGSGRVIGEFICDKVIKYEEHIKQGGLYYTLDYGFNEACQLDNWELHDYGKGKPLYGWHISDLKIYDKPRELCEFTAPCKQHKTKPDESCKGCPYIFKGMTSGKLTCDRAIMRAPKSWMYVEEV